MLSRVQCCVKSSIARWIDEAPHPFTVTEQNFTIESATKEGQPLCGVLPHARGAINYHYERVPDDHEFGTHSRWR